MTVPTLAQLMTPVTEEEALHLFLRTAAGLGLDVDAWTDVGVATATANYSASATVANNVNTVAIAASGHLDTAVGIGLDLWALSQYQELRNRAVRATWTLTLVPDANAPTPQTFQPSDLVAVATDGATFRNTTAGTLVANTPLELEWQAEAAGLSGNLSGVDGDLILQTPISGVTITKPASANTAGTNDERDSALRERCRTKWASLNSNGTEASYEYHARTAEAAVDRVQIDTRANAANGDVTVYVASSEGPVGVPDAIAAVQRYIMGHDGSGGFDPMVQRAGYGAEITVVDAAPVGGSGLNLSCTVTALNAFATPTLSAEVGAAFDAYLGTVPIGGKKLNPLNGYDGSVPLGDLFAAALEIPGVQNISFSSLSGDPAMVPGEVAVKSAATLIQVQNI